jgi:hypothetical protein
MSKPVLLGAAGLAAVYALSQLAKKKNTVKFDTEGTL